MKMMRLRVSILADLSECSWRSCNFGCICRLMCKHIFSYHMVVSQQESAWSRYGVYCANFKWGWLCLKMLGVFVTWFSHDHSIHHSWCKALGEETMWGTWVYKGGYYKLCSNKQLLCCLFSSPLSPYIFLQVFQARHYMCVCVYYAYMICHWDLSCWDTFTGFLALRFQNIS